MLDTYTGRWKQNRRKYSDDMDIKKQINDLEAEIYACNSFLKLFFKILSARNLPNRYNSEY